MTPQIGKWVNTTSIIFPDIAMIAESLAYGEAADAQLCSFEKIIPALV